MNRRFALFWCLFLSGCGNDESPTTPSASTTASPTPTPASTTGTVTTLTFTSTLSGNPVAGARVVVAGTAYTTSAEGTIALSTPAASTATVDASAPGFLDRRTIVGSTSPLTLWEIPAGADAAFVRQLAYNRGGTPEVLWRPTSGVVNLQLTGEIASDPEVRSAHVQAAAMASGMTDAKIRVELGSSSTVMTILVNPSNSGSATTYLAQNGGAIVGGRIEYTSIGAARNVRVVAHELGHVLGFGHASSGLMCPSACGASAFGPLEHDVFASMWQRLPGTAAPDNDRSVFGRSESRDAVFNCDIQ